MLAFIYSLAGSTLSPTASAVDRFTGYFTPPPSGLTNLQSKVIGPLFTDHPIHSHSSSDVSLMTLAQHQAHAAYTIDQATGLVKLQVDCRPTPLRESRCVYFENFDGLVETAKSDLVWRAEVETAIVISASSMAGGEQLETTGKIRGESAYFHIAAAILAQEARATDRSESTLLPLCVPAGVLLPVENFGHLLERMVSAALVGEECCWQAVNAQFLRVLRSGPAKDDGDDDDEKANYYGQLLLHVAKCAGMEVADVRKYSDAVERGVALPTRLRSLLLHVTANLLCRCIVVCDTSEGNSILFLPTMPLRSAAQNIKEALFRPIVFEDNNVVLVFDRDGALGSTLPPAKVAFTSIYPPDDDALQQQVVDEDGFSISVNRSSSLALQLVCPGAGLPASLGISCQLVDHDRHGKLSFATFPASYFSVSRLGHQPEADALLKSFEYGEDTFAVDYLAPLLNKSSVDGQQLLTNVCVLKADADGHCLTHAVSRCLVGKQYLWHALRHAIFDVMAPETEKEKETEPTKPSRHRDHDDLVEVLKSNEVLAGVIDELPALSDRAHPEYPYYIASQMKSCEESMVKGPISIERGLGNEHVFALACLLRRPILLLDNPLNEQRQSFLFLPLNVKPQHTVTKKILTIAWSNGAHCHYVAIVPCLGNVKATIAQRALPRNQDGSIAVYCAPSSLAPHEVTSLAHAYLGGDDERYEIGGEVQFDINPWLNRLVKIFEAQCGGSSIWSLHEFVRAAASASRDPSTTIESLGCIPSVQKLVELYTKNVEKTTFGICSFCTRTFSDVTICGECRMKLTMFDRHAGRYNFSEKDRVPVPSTAGSTISCCVHKHWHQNQKVGPGSQVWARDLCSYFAPATVLDFCASDGTYDVEFRFGKRRYAVPTEDVMHGFPLDANPVVYRTTALGLRITICKDEDPLLSTDPNQLDTLIDDAAAEQHIPLPTLLMRSNIKDFLVERCRMQRTTTISAYEPIFADSEGNKVEWQWFDDYEYVPYENQASGLIEAAFQAKEISTIVTTRTALGLAMPFQIDFSTLEQIGQVNVRRMRRCVIKPLPKGLWDCAACTYSNPDEQARRCEVCGTARQSDTIVTHRSADEEKEERARNINWADIEASTDRDVALHFGGDLYKAAFAVYGSAMTRQVLSFPMAYPDYFFAYIPEFEKLLVVPLTIPPTHRLHRHILEESFKRHVPASTSSTSSTVVYAWRSAMYFEMTNDGSFVRSLD